MVSEQLFGIPENISVREDPDGIEYENHLLASPDTGIAKIKLNGWKASLIEEESRRSDFLFVGCVIPPELRGCFACPMILVARRNPSIPIF